MTTAPTFPKVRKTKLITKCPHINKKHYAKGMCNYCYNLKGRTQFATKCPHLKSWNYAKGYCRKCYTTYLRLSEKKKLDLFAKIGKTFKAAAKKNNKTIGNIQDMSQTNGVPLSKADLEVLKQYDSKWPI